MIVSLICGRSESEPFPGRNTFPLLGRPMMVYPILAAKNSETVSHVFLSTDDSEMARIGQFHGAKILERPSSLRGDNISLEEILNHSYKEIEKITGGPVEILIVLLANAPTITSELIDQGVGVLQSRPLLDGIMTVSINKAFHPDHAVQIDKEGLAKPFIQEKNSSKERAYFPNALLWGVKASSFSLWEESKRNNTVVNIHRQKVGSLIHEGYGDVDFPWQVPAIETWLRRRGFTEEKTPYKTQYGIDAKLSVQGSSGKTRNVFISTVPFAEENKTLISQMESKGVKCVLNPVGRRLKEDELLRFLKDCEVLLAGTEPITREVIEKCERLKLISRVGIGLNNIDLFAAREKGIAVTYTPDAPSPAVAELTVGLMLSLIRKTHMADYYMRNGVWHRFMGRRLSELTVGIIGMGRIGQRVARHLSGGFPGVRVLGNDLKTDNSFEKKLGLEWASKELIYKEADIITFHIPLTKKTKSLVTKKELNLMKSSSIIINTSRGGIIHEKDLAESLRSGGISAAAVDVFEREPYFGELSLLPNCLLTCHMGSMSKDCRHQMELEAVEDVLNYLDGSPLKRPVPEFEYEAVKIQE